MRGNMVFGPENGSPLLLRFFCGFVCWDPLVKIYFHTNSIHGKTFQLAKNYLNIPVTRYIFSSLF